MKFPISIILHSFLLISTATPWWAQYHTVLTKAAVQALPGDIPRFFRESGVAIGHYAVDPDVLKGKATPHLRAAEYPEHYFDRELFADTLLPATRYGFIFRCAALGVAPEKIGFLPYAVLESAERLAYSFAEHRKWPKNTHVQSKCLMYAGHLSHYSQDLCQPLHMTIHYDGRADSLQNSPRSGIHDRVDGLFERTGCSIDSLKKAVRLDPVANLDSLIVRKLSEGLALVDTVYALEPQLMEDLKQTPSPALIAFSKKQAQSAASLTASLFAYAWQKSKTVPIESWLTRE